MSDPIFQISSLKEFKKIAFITPSSNITLEILTTAILSQLPLVSAHYSRLPVTTTDLSSGAASQFTSESLVAVAKLLANAPIQTILWNGTSESWTGEGYTAGLKIVHDITTATGLPASTSSLAQIEVLKRYGIKKISLATPYTQEPNKRLKEYYGSQGIEVIKCIGLGISINNEIGDVPIERIKDLIRETDDPETEAIIIPCTNFPAALVVEEMEMELGKPIFDSVIVTLWKGLNLLNITTPIHGWGYLLRNHPVLTKLDDIMEILRGKTESSRTTLRIDIPERNCYVDRVISESRGKGIHSLRPNTSLNQRSLKTCIFINEMGKALIQNDMRHSEIRPPEALMSVYGVKSQMLCPLMYGEGEGAGGWISVHEVGGMREWRGEDVEVLFGAGRDVLGVLEGEGWVERGYLVVPSEFVVR